MANLLDWFGDRAKDVGRIIGTAADAVVPGNQSNWHQPAAPRPVQQAPRPVQQAQPRQDPFRFLMNSPVVRYNPINPMAGINMASDASKLKIPGIGVSAQQVGAQLPQAFKTVGNLAEASNQTFIGGLGRELTNLADPATKLMMGPTGFVADQLTHGKVYKSIDQAKEAAKKTFFPEAGTKNSLSPTKLEDYTPGMKVARTVGSAQKVIAEQVPMMLLSGGAGNAAEAGASALPLGEGIAAKVVPKLASGFASGATFGGLQGGLDGKSIPEIAKQAAGWGTAGAVGGAVTPLIPNVGKIPLVRAIPRAAAGAGLGWLTAPLAGMSREQGAAFGLLAGSEHPYAKGDVRTPVPTVKDGKAIYSTAPKQSKVVTQLNADIAEHPGHAANVSELSKAADNSLLNKNIGEKPGGLKRATDEILAGNHAPVHVKINDMNGAVTIIDGRHHLEAARRLGLDNYPIVVVDSPAARKFGVVGDGIESVKPKTPAGERPVYQMAPKPGKAAPADSITMTAKDTVYHGTSPKDATSLMANGFNPAKSAKGDSVESPYALFASRTAKAGDDHSAGTYGKSIVPISPKSDVHMLDANSQTWADTMGKSKGAADSARIAAELKAKGYAGIIEQNGEVTILDPSKFNIGKRGAGVSTPKPEKPGGYVYHTTSMDNLNKIQFEGMKPNTGQYGKGVYFAPTPEQTGGYGSATGAMIRVKRSNLPKDFQEFPEQGWTAKSVAPHKIEASIDGGKTWHSIADAPKPTEPVAAPTQPKGGFATSVAKSAETSPELQAAVKRQGITYTPVTNAEQTAASEALLKKGWRKAATQVNEQLDAKLGTISDQTTADAIAVIKKLDAKGGDANLALATDLTEKLSAHLTKAGQTIQAASLLSNRTPEGLMYGARKVLKKAGVELTPELQTKIKGLVDAAAALPPGEEKQYALAALSQEVSKHIPSSLADKGVALWKAGLLTGIKTQTGNALSNVTSIGLKTASNPLAAAIDRLVSVVTGERAKTFTLKGDLSGAAEGVGRGIKAMKTGVNENDLAHIKFDTKQVNFGDGLAGRAAQKYVDTVFNLMGAADKPYYYSQLRNNLQDIAKAEAINAGAKGAARQAFIDEFLKNPPTEAFQTATHAAEKSVFANDTLLSKGAAGIRNSMSGHPAAEAVINVIMPFTKVPSAVITRLFDYTPVGAVKTVIQQIGKGNFNQRQLSEGLAEAATGTGVIAIGYALAHKGLMTGSYPTDKKEQELWKLEGKQANAIKVGGKWQSINYTSPAGQILAIGQQIADAQKNGATALEASGVAGAGAAKAVLSQSFLQGVQGSLDAINDPQANAAKYFKQQAGSVIPTLVGDTAKAIDPLQRQANNPIEAIQAKIPFANQALLPKQDAFGAPMPRASSAINTMANPFRPSDVKPTNPLNTELRRLQDAGEGVMPNTTDKTLSGGSGDSKYSVKLNPQQLYDKNASVGPQTQELWNKIIASPAYAKLDDIGKSAALKKAYTDINHVETAKVVTSQGVQLKKQPGSVGSAESYATGSSGAATTPKERYTKALESYKKDKADGKISGPKDITKQRELTKLKVESDYSQNATDLYSLPYKDMVSFVTSDKNGKSLWDEVQKLDKAMTAAGYTSKIFDKYGRFKKYTSGSSAKGGSTKAKKAKVAKTSGNYNAVRNIASTKGKKLAVSGLAGPKFSVKALPKIKKAKAFA